MGLGEDSLFDRINRINGMGWEDRRGRMEGGEMFPTDACRGRMEGGEMFPTDECRGRIEEGEMFPTDECRATDGGEERVPNE